jgi:hypothetical protein
MRFVIAPEKHEEPFAAVCGRFGESRKVGYKWLERYQEAGVGGRAWGPLKVRAYLERRAPGKD